MIFSKRHIFYFFILLFCSCSLGPRYKRPPTYLPASWDAESSGLWKKVERKGGNFSKENPPTASQEYGWWKSFSDPALENLLVNLEKNNYSLEASYQRLLQAKSVLASSRSDFFPEINLQGEYSRTKNSDATSSSVNDFYNLPFSLSWELDFWGKIKNQVKSSKSAFKANRADYANALLVLQTELASNYFFLRTVDEEIRIVRKAISKRNENLKLVTKRYELGFTNAIDVERAKTELSDAEAELSNLYQSRGLSKNAISVLLAKFPQEFDIDYAPLVNNWSNPPKLLPSDLLERRPDVINSENLLMQANAEIGIAEAAFYPSFNLSALYGGASSDFSKILNSDSRVWSIGPFFNLPIFTAGENRANLKRSEARYLETVASYRETVLQAVREVEDSLLSLRTLYEQERKQKQAADSAKRVAEMSLVQYQSGLGSFFEVVDAERELLIFERQLVQTKGAKLLAEVSLIKALGGGWQATSGNCQSNQ